MKGLDTNVLVRYLVQDDTKQAALATRYIEKECTAESPCFIGQLVLCELAWVLESNYGVGRIEIADIFESILQVGQFEVMGADIAWRALRDYKNSSADFSDHLLAKANVTQGCVATLTFDRKAGLTHPFQILK